MAHPRNETTGHGDKLCARSQRISERIIRLNKLRHAAKRPARSPLNFGQNVAIEKPSDESTICRLSRILTIRRTKVDYPHLWFFRDRREAPPGSTLTANHCALEILP
jgi:hypothetical protein